MKRILNKLSIALTMALGLATIQPACAMQELDFSQIQAPVSFEAMQEEITKSLPSKERLLALAKNAAIVASLDLGSQAVASVAEDYFGSALAGHCTATALNALMLIHVSALEQYKNGTLSLRNILPIDVVMNADGIMSQPVISGLLTAASFASAYAGEGIVTPLTLLSATVALKLALFKDNKEAFVYNMSSHASSAALCKAWAYVKNIVL